MHSNKKKEEKEQEEEEGEEQEKEKGKEEQEEEEEGEGSRRRKEGRRSLFLSMHNCGKEENHVTDFRFLTPADLFFEQKP